MVRNRVEQAPPIEPREFRSVEEIDSGIAKLERPIRTLEALNIPAAVMNKDVAKFTSATMDVTEAICDVFGANSPEFYDHHGLALWVGREPRLMDADETIRARERGRTQAIGILSGLIGRLREKQNSFLDRTNPASSTSFGRLNLHPNILEVSRERFLDGYPWDAVFAASKALVNYVRERSGCNLDGASLMRTVFSRNDPILAFNDLINQTDHDEQEGMMHLFEGAVLAIRNPGGHSFPEGPEQHAIEYISLLSLLAYRVQEAKKRKSH